ncbi:hypothetical protein [Cohaesibacter intestini]|uniref:hypothetical protein n=1 Tax=Cohaesibacter intestini TaxID=2211145 RepID=UPI000DE9E6F3|nr:hypothetical protein [Cohaesibacter intestini]
MSDKNETYGTYNDVPVLMQHLDDALLQLPETFDTADFVQALADAGQKGADDEKVHQRLLQQCKRDGKIKAGTKKGKWQKANGFKTSRPGRMTTIVMVFSVAVCMLIWVAQIAINVRFAWEIAGSDFFFRSTLVAIMAALDLGRPLFVAKGINLVSRHLCGQAVPYFVIGFMLASVSFLCSSSMLSASFAQGQLINSRIDQNQEKIESLKADVKEFRLQAIALQAEADEECAHGGCGPKARKLQNAAEVAELQAKDAQSQLDQMSSKLERPPQMIAGLVLAFEDMHLYGDSHKMRLPYLLALVIELAALFGPGLLLRR